MINGEIEQTSSLVSELKTVIIDVELLISKKKKFLIFTSFYYSRFNANLIRYVRNNKAGIDVFEICAVSNKKVLKLVKDELQLMVVTKNFSSEDSYKNYIISRNCEAHISTSQRKNYSQKSIQLTGDEF